MRSAVLGVVFVLTMFASVDVLAQQGPPVENIDPGDGSGGGVLGCDECSVGPEGYASCEEPEGGGHWANCRGGRICYPLADGTEYCQPDCGGQRCYLA